MFTKRALAALFLAACGLGSSIAAQAAGTLDQIKESKQIALGYREASVPFSYIDQNQKPVGFSLDLCARIVAQIKQTLALPALDVKYIAVTGGNRIPLIQNGTIAIECGGTSSSVERMKQVDFSVATFISHTKWMTKVNSGIHSAKDLKGKTVVVTQGSNAVQIAKEVSDKNGLGLRVVQAHDHAESMLMLDTGRASAFMEDDILLAAKKADAADPAQYTFLPDDYNTLAYGLMLPKGDEAFKALVDKTLSSMMASGEFMTLYKKWFETAIPPHDKNLNFPVSDDLKARIAHPSDQVPG